MSKTDDQKWQGPFFRYLRKLGACSTGYAWARAKAKYRQATNVEDFLRICAWNAHNDMDLIVKASQGWKRRRNPTVITMGMAFIGGEGAAGYLKWLVDAHLKEDEKKEVMGMGPHEAVKFVLPRIKRRIRDMVRKEARK